MSGYQYITNRDLHQNYSRAAHSLENGAELCHRSTFQRNQTIGDDDNENFILYVAASTEMPSLACRIKMSVCTYYDRQKPIYILTTGDMNIYKTLTSICKANDFLSKPRNSDEERYQNVRLHFKVNVSTNYADNRQELMFELIYSDYTSSLSHVNLHDCCRIFHQTTTTMIENYIATHKNGNVVFVACGSINTTLFLTNMIDFQKRFKFDVDNGYSSFAFNMFISKEEGYKQINANDHFTKISHYFKCYIV